MANIVRVSAELKKKYNDPYRNFKDLMQDFKRKVNASGIMHEYRDHEFYITGSEKRRKRKKDQAKKQQMDMLEKKILAGEKVKVSSVLMKKVMSNMNKSSRYNED